VTLDDSVIRLRFLSRRDAGAPRENDADGLASAASLSGADDSVSPLTLMLSVDTSPAVVGQRTGMLWACRKKFSGSTAAFTFFRRSKLSPQ
jgi:hypothetical protein